MNEIVFFFLNVGKNAAAVVVQAQVSGGVEAGAARRAMSNAGAVAMSEGVHGAKSESGRNLAARIVVDAIMDAKAPCELTLDRSI